MKKITAGVLVGVVLAFLVAWKAVLSRTPPVFPRPPQVSVEKLNELVTLHVRMSTLLTGENDWYKGVWEVGGDAWFGTDCRKAEWASIDPETKTFTLRLPGPGVTAARVDHKCTRLYDFRAKAWLNPARWIYGNPDEIREEAMKHAQEKLENEARLDDYLLQAKEQAESNLKKFYTPLGWALTVEWLPRS